MAKLNAKLPDVFKTGRTVAVGSKRAAEQTDQAEGAPV